MRRAVLDVTGRSAGTKSRARFPHASRLVRVFAVSGLVAASMLVGSASRADHVIVFTDCSSSQPAPSASPRPTHTPSPTQPGATSAPQNCVPPEGDRIWGDRLLRFDVEDNGSRINDVKLSILSQEKGIPSANGGKPVATWLPDDGQRTFWYGWNSVELTPYNGRYKVVVESTASSPSSHTASKERVDLRVDNPPGAVAAPKIVATPVGGVTISWRKAVERDVLSYSVYRASSTSTKDAKTPPYSAFRKVDVTHVTTFRDTGLKSGYHWYAVRVTRRSVVTPDTGISSAMSPISRRATVVSLNRPPPKGGKPPHPVADLRSHDFPPLVLPHLPDEAGGGLADGTYEWVLPYDHAATVPGHKVPISTPASGPVDPRGPVLPVAVGMFLVSSALAVGRMPY